jgi:UDP-3-O-[3-hydroxymyristoyl] glucosamine N-acyltransferase
MKLPQPTPLRSLAQLISGEVIGNAEALVTGINEIHKVEPGDLTFVDFHKYYDRALASNATFILANKKLEMPNGKSLVISDDPFRDYNILVRHFSPSKTPTELVHPGAVIGEGSIVEPGAFIGEDVVIGRNCRIRSNVTICCPARIGDNVIIHPGTVIGADAFYYKRRADRPLQHDKLLSCGSVVIENDVEIGANCTIDRGVSGETRIGAGTKIDNLVHIAHGVIIGRNCLIAAQCGIAGKAILGDNVTLWGQVGVSKDLTIESGAEVYAQSGVASSIGPGKWFGSPVVPAKEHIKVLGILKHLPELWEKLKRK